jgi:tyrosyl-tRNA synthetase
MTLVKTNVLDALAERGFVNQVSDEAALRRVLEQPITLYCGFDATADSLHAGHLVQIMALAHFQRHGHRPIALVGGGTTLVGDPTGRTAGRPILTETEINANAERLKEQMSHYFDFADGRALMRNNADWLTKLHYIPFLRDIGRHFSVNQMLAMETYKTRLETGLSFLEFNYLLLQSYDFLHLYREYGCVLQVGGGDQWSNCLGGMDLIRRADGGEAFVMTTPLISTASGEKMGKTAGNAVWLDPDRTSPYAYYQYWINTDDADVEKFLAFFTFLPMEEVRRLGALKGEDTRQAKEVLAFEATKLTHGEAAAREAQAASRALFSGAGALEAAPTTAIPAGDLVDGLSLADLFVRAGLAGSRNEARRLAAQGGASVDGERVTDMDRTLTMPDIPGEGLLLRAGKKRYQRIVIG